VVATVVVDVAAMDAEDAASSDITD
jgi:hypothetical protein